jgi:hypothetical protein
MRRTSLRVGVAVLAALAVAAGISLLYAAMYVVTVGEPPSRLSAPRWLEPFSESVRLSCYLVPGVVLGALARWHPGLIGFALGFVVAYVLDFDTRLGVRILEWQLGMALSSALLWAMGAMAGSHLAQRWTPNKSLERTREG